MPGLLTLHPGQGRLCSYGPLGPDWWSPQMRSGEIPWLSWKYLGWWVSPQVQVYELEDIKKRSDESINELIDSICQLTHHAQIGNGSDAAMDFEVQCRFIWAIPDVDIKLWKELLKVNCEKVSHLLEISHTYYAIESEAAAMCAGKAIHALCQGHLPQKKATKVHFTVLQLHLFTPPGHDNFPAWNAIWKGCSKKVTGMQSAAALVLPANNPLSLIEMRRPPIIDAMKRGRKLIWYKLTLRKHPHVMSCLLMQSIVEL